MRAAGIVLAVASLAGAAEPTGKPWLDMDYGPFLSAAIEAPRPPKNIAAKGIAIRLRDAGGGAEAAMLFDTDLLRWAAGWEGGFVALKGVVFDGEHWAFPRIEGRQAFGTAVAPGWARRGSFDDPRPIPYGPLPRDWARWQGLYVHGDSVVLSYRVGAVRVLELPEVERDGEGVRFSRTIELLDAGAAALDVLVADAPDGTAPHVAVVDPTGRAVLRPAAGGRQVAGVSPGPAPFVFRVVMAAAPLTAPLAPARGSLVPLTGGGQPKWAQDVITRGKAGAGTGPLAVDVITAPDDNPWRSWMRFGGFDFLDATTCVLCTWNGDVWIVRGVDDGLERLAWRRIAAGLHQPLGLKVRDGQVFAVDRDQITRLADLNGDGETDFYECFNNEQENTEHFHEFAMDLQADLEGNFYFMKGARHALDSLVPQHGTLVKVAADGSRLEILANGFRAPNGLCITPAGELYSTDQQGHWLPANRINRLTPGSFHGNMYSYHRGPRPERYDEPVCWIHPGVDRSPSTLVHVSSPRWGALTGKLLGVSYGMGQLFVVPEDRVEVEGKGVVVQGGVVKLPLELDTGVCRGRFHASDGQLYLCGLYGWAGNKTRPGGFFRIRATGKPLGLPVGFHAFEGGLDLEFSEPLDAAAACNPASYAVQCWNYRWTKEYGSPDVRFDGSEGRETLPVAGAELLPGGKTVRLALPGLRPVMQLHVEMRLAAAGGAPIRTALHATVHALGPRPADARPAAARIAETPGARALAAEAPGLRLEITPAGGGDADLRPSRLAAIHVPAGEPPAALVGPGPFTAVWTGCIKLDLGDEAAFALAGRGAARLAVNGRPVLEGDAADEPGATSRPVALQQGLNTVELRYRSPPSGDAWLRLYWRLGDGPLEPVPPTALVHDGAGPGLETADRRRRGRELVLAHGCRHCHREDGAEPDAVKPGRGPSLAGAGSMWKEEWLAAWIESPHRLRADARMPAALPGDDADRSRAARDVARYLSALDDTGGAFPPEPSPQAAAAGEKLWEELGCFTCHRLPGEPEAAAGSRLPLDGVRAKWRPGALVEYLQAPARRHPRTRMPDFRLAAAEAEALAAFLLSRSSGAPPPAAPLHSPADADRGRRIAAAARCAACHELPGAPAPAGATPLSRLSSGLDRGCLSSDPAADGAPDFRWSDEERALIGEHLAERRPARESSIEAAERLVRELHCGACHRRDGAGDAWSVLQPEPDDAAMDPTLPRTIHRQRPPLTWAGEKLRPEWTRELLAGALRYKPRARSAARMPAFAAYAVELARGLSHGHGFADASPPPAAPVPGLAAAGERLTQATGFACLGCHPVQGRPALAGPDTETIDLSRFAHRLTGHFYSRFLLDPGRVLPDSMMPRYTTGDGRSVLTEVLGGDAARQFQAIWHYLHTIASDAGQP